MREDRTLWVLAIAAVFVATLAVGALMAWTAWAGDAPTGELIGDIDPATNKLTGDYGNKSIGAVKPEDSLITEDNGFVNILTFKGSPLGEIDRRDKMYESNN